jgi:hypothetical protein
MRASGPLVPCESGATATPDRDIGVVSGEALSGPEDCEVVVDALSSEL